MHLTILQPKKLPKIIHIENGGWSYMMTKRAHAVTFFFSYIFYTLIITKQARIVRFSFIRKQR